MSRLAHRGQRRAWQIAIASAVLVTALGVAGWLMRDTPLGWQVGEYASLASLGSQAQEADSAVFSGTEHKVTFGADPQQYAYVVLPPKSVAVKKTAVLFVYGGGWSMGNADLYRFAGRFFAARGYPTIVAGYRLAPGSRFPAQLDDVRASLARGLAELDRSGVSVDGFVIGGHSAGAQLAALLALEQGSNAVAGSRLLGLISLSGPLDFSLCSRGRIAGMIEDLVGPGVSLRAADPIQHVTATVPVLLIHGAHDPVVSVRNAESFAAKLDAVGAPKAAVTIVSGAYHSDVLDLFFRETPTRQTLLDWLERIDAR